MEAEGQVRTAAVFGCVERGCGVEMGMGRKGARPLRWAALERLRGWGWGGLNQGPNACEP
jgi:hypothetical protein